LAEGVCLWLFFRECVHSVCCALFVGLCQLTHTLCAGIACCRVQACGSALTSCRRRVERCTKRKRSNVGLAVWQLSVRSSCMLMACVWWACAGCGLGGHSLRSSGLWRRQNQL
jgi:hypothetical protein